MAFDINPYLVLSLKSPRNWRGIYRHLFRRQINYQRTIRRRRISNEFLAAPTESFDSESWICGNLNEHAEHFREEGWAFISNFFAPDVHKEILDSWPALSCFRVGSDPAKSYDKGPSWSDRNSWQSSGAIKPEFFKGFQALSSSDFAKKVSLLCGDGIARESSGLASAWARSGSLLLPHVDDVWRFGRGAVVNFVIFIDGSTPVSVSGATGIYGTNTYSDPIFVPPVLRNTALVYETGRLIYHGFPPVGRGKFSKRLIAQYSPVNQPKLSEAIRTGKIHTKAFSLNLEA